MKHVLLLLSLASCSFASRADQYEAAYCAAGYCDAGAPDDGGQPDAGSVDAGAVDAGRPDGGCVGGNWAARFNISNRISAMSPLGCNGALFGGVAQDFALPNFERRADGGALMLFGRISDLGAVAQVVDFPVTEGNLHGLFEQADGGLFFAAQMGPDTVNALGSNLDAGSVSVLFVGVLSSDFQPLWVKSFGPASLDVTQVLLDVNGDLLVAGFTGSGSGARLTLGGVTVQPSTAFIARVTPAKVLTVKPFATGLRSLRVAVAPSESFVAARVVGPFLNAPHSGATALLRLSGGSPFAYVATADGGVVDCSSLEIEGESLEVACSGSGVVFRADTLSTSQTDVAVVRFSKTGQAQSLRWAPRRLDTSATLVLGHAHTDGGLFSVLLDLPDIAADEFREVVMLDDGGTVAVSGPQVATLDTFVRTTERVLTAGRAAQPVSVTGVWVDAGALPDGGVTGFIVNRRSL